MKFIVPEGPKYSQNFIVCFYCIDFRGFKASKYMKKKNYLRNIF